MARSFLFLLALIVFFSSCCSTIHTGSTQMIHFESKPMDASIKINGKYNGNSPLMVKLERKGRENEEGLNQKYHEVEFTIDGYHPYTFRLNREVRGCGIGNILLGGFIGFIIDGSTGTLYELEPDRMSGFYNDSPMNFHEDQGELYILVVLKADPEWKKVGQLKETQYSN